VQRVDLSEAAAEELDEAYRWYEKQREGLGDELLEEFLRSVERVRASPRLYPLVENEIRRAQLHRFPYALFYRLEPDSIVMIAFFHGKRDPIHWKKRR
jgi:plasmid stabilization system protein ParE